MKTIYKISFNNFKEILSEIKKDSENAEQFKWAVYYYFKEIGKRANLISITDYREETNYYTLTGDWAHIGLDLNDDQLLQIASVITKQYYYKNSLGKLL